MGILRFYIGLAVCTSIASGYRLGREEMQKKLTFDSKATSAPRCQYSATPSVIESGRPPHESLLAICPDNELLAKCQLESKSSSKMTLVVKDKSVGVADCESYCNENKGMQHFKDPVCRGYVVRNPFNDGVEKGKAQCWLIHGDAKNSSSFPTEVKIDRSTLHDHRNNKITYHKEFCGCDARILHFPRPEFRTELAIKRHELAELTKERMENPDNAELILKLTDLKLQVKKMEIDEVNYEHLKSIEGVYDWLPIRVPHRVAKGTVSVLERVLPGEMIRWFKPGTIKNQRGSWKNYWQAPVKISKIFKKTDLSSILYLCQDKTSKKQDWYVTNMDALTSWAQDAFRYLRNMSQEQIEEEVKDARFVKKAWFCLKCLGTKIDSSNMVTYQVEKANASKEITMSAQVDHTFWDSKEAPEDPDVPMSLQPFGCFENAKKAQDAVEEKVMKEVGVCPIEHLSNSQTKEEDTEEEKEKIGWLSFWRSKDQSVMAKMGRAQWLAEKLSKDTTAAYFSISAAKWYSRGQAWWYGKKADKDVKQFHDYSKEEIQSMLDRTAVLLEGFGKLWLVMEAVSNTDDEEIKSVCSRELLDQIFAVGGLMPKVSQNLAMRPDLVKDDFVRNKLKETQNANPSRDKAGTMEYLSKHNPNITLPGIPKVVPLLDLLEYNKALSAGSVGQVDLFNLKKDAKEEWKKAFRALLPEGHGDTVIVKTVFEETEDAYRNGWNLLELFFTNCGDGCDAKMRVMWKILEPMKKSIFDEFNLTDEATFTARGKKMLAEFTKNVDEGFYKGVLEPGSIKLTTPNAVATSSNYILIQSMAAGTPLKNFLEDSGGQIERLVDWRSRIYSAILMVYGHMVVKHGFFQSDPHNGNWFWEPKSKTVTLIDWGGVGVLDEATHCKLANLYSHLGKLTEEWSQCESVELVESTGEISGVYQRAGFSIYQANEGEEALIYGKTYGVSYFNEASGLRLFYHDSGMWKVVREHAGTQELTETVADLSTKITNMPTLSMQTPQKWQLTTQGRKKSKTVEVKMKDPTSCGLPTRSQAYSKAAYKMGLGLNFACEPEDTVVIPEAPLSQDPESMAKWTDTGKRQLGCLHRTEEETFIQWGLFAKLKLMVETKDGKRTVTLPDNKTYDLDEDPLFVPDPNFAFPSGWVLDAFSNESQAKIDKLPVWRKTKLLKEAQAQLAVATSLYDSDILMAAVLGLKAKGSVGLVTPEVPDEYVLLARCIVVFHGMLGDVLKDNFIRFMVTGQQDYVQWLLRSGGDRFFRSWLKPAKDFVSTGQCKSKDWDELYQPY